MTQLVEALSKGGKGRIVKSRFGNVIKTDYGEVFRYPSSQAAGRAHQSERHLIVAGEDRLQVGEFLQEGMETLFATFRRPFAFHNPILAKRDFGFPKSILPAAATLTGRPPGQRSGDETDLSITLLQEM